MFSEGLVPFWISAALLLGLVGFEALAVVFGMSGLSGGEAEAEAPHALAWLNQGRAPLLIVLMIMLGLFAASGFLLQGAALALAGFLPAPAAAAIAAGFTLIATSHTTRLIAAVLPRNESYAASAEELLGRKGVVTLGPLSADKVGRVRVQDAHGNAHFPLVRPLQPDLSIPEGAEVLLAERAGGEFRVVLAPKETSAGQILRIGGVE